VKRAGLFPIAVAVAVAFATATAAAQRFDPRRPKTLIVAKPGGPAPMMRVDARRSGLSKTPLPSGTLRIALRHTTGLTLDQPALAGSDGLIAVVSPRGDVAWLDENGEERATVRVGAPLAGPAAITSDGTIVYATGAGDAIGVRRGSTVARFTTHIGDDARERSDRRVAPLPLDDGGIVLATGNDLALLDAEGTVRSRVTLPEPVATPLLAWSDRVVAIGATGTIFGWSPGREAVRLGSFGAPIDGGAALENGTLVAVIEGNQIAEVDLVRGGRTTRTVASQGLLLGPPAVRTSLVSVLALTQTRGFVVTLDPSGHETVRAPVASFTPQPLPDGGMPALVAPQHVGVLVDPRGAVAFAATDGSVGVIGPEGAVETLGEAPCTKGPRAGVIGLTPFGAGSFLVTCEGGVVLRITGAALK
jgi:outer membrane protein assembly factor BamB